MGHSGGELWVLCPLSGEFAETKTAASDDAAVEFLV